MKKFIILASLCLMGTSAFASKVHCRFEPIGKPMTYVQYDIQTRTLWVQSGWPQAWTEYRQVEEYTGLPPFYNTGVSLVAFGDVPVIHVRQTGNGSVWYERNTTYAYEAYWGIAPGGPAEKNLRGVCWTDQLPPQTTYND